MIINNHLIDESAILGIGPINTEDHPSESEAHGYGTARFWYDLHLVSRTARIYSPWFRRKDDSDKLAMAQWRKDYNDCRAELEEKFSGNYSTSIQEQLNKFL